MRYLTGFRSFPSLCASFWGPWPEFNGTCLMLLAHRRRVRWFWWLRLISFPGFDTQTRLFLKFSLSCHTTAPILCASVCWWQVPPPPPFSDLSKVQERTVSSAEFIRLQASLQRFQCISSGTQHFGKKKKQRGGGGGGGSFSRCLCSASDATRGW